MDLVDHLVSSRVPTIDIMHMHTQIPMFSKQGIIVMNGIINTSCQTLIKLHTCMPLSAITVTTYYVEEAEKMIKTAISQLAYNIRNQWEMGTSSGPDLSQWTRDCRNR